MSQVAPRLTIHPALRILAGGLAGAIAFFVAVFVRALIEDWRGERRWDDQW